MRQEVFRLRGTVRETIEGWGRSVSNIITVHPGPRPLILFLILLVLVIGLPVAAVGGPPGPRVGPPPLVKIAPVVLEDVNPPVEYVGHVEAIQAVDLRARVEGFLEKVAFKEGEGVRAGDLLYVIEQAPYRARVAEDKAREAQAQAELTRACKHLERLRAARPESVPATDMDNAVADERTAKAQLAQARAALAVSSLNLGYTTITAPISGRIGRTAYTRGNLVGSTSGPLARIVQMDPIRVVYSISENDLTAIQIALKDAARGWNPPALTPRLRLANGTMLNTDGRVDFVNNEVDPGTGTIAVWAVFDNPDGLLLPGEYVTVLVKASAPRLMPVVSQAAVQQDQEGPYVLIVGKDNHVGIRRVKTGPVIGGLWAIESGLAKGERVIVQGVQKIRPGMIVKTSTENRQGR